jgi:hypothetical protein
MTPEQVHDEVLELRAEIQKQFLQFSTEMLKAFGDFKADLIKTLWITQLSAIGIILIGMGLLIRFLH